MRPALAIALACGLGACAARLPTYPPASPQETWQVLGQQRVSTISAAGDVTLWTDAGRATLRCAIASDGAGKFRMRAWKLDQAALDITLVDGALWVYAARADDDIERLRAADIAQAWALVSGAVFDCPAPAATPESETIEYVTADGVRITVDRTTRTARRFEAQGLQGSLSLALRDFTMVDERPWPMRIDLEAGARRARIRLDTVDLGAPLPERAFEPPRRAVRVEQP